MRRAPILLRLTAWYVLVLAAVLIALGAFVVTRLRSDLTSEIDRGLGSAAGQIAAGYRAEGPQEFRDVSRTALPGPRNRGSGTQILDSSGVVLLADGDAVTRAPLLGRSALARVLAGRRAAASIRRGSSAEHLRTLAIPAQRAGQRQVLVVAESLDDVDESVDRVKVLLALGSLTALGLMALGGWWIARKALRPVERMTTRADRIGIDDLSQRIAVPRVQDEVGHLARTLNAMLDRLEQGVQARQRLVADASHELRAPLASMRSELEVSLRHDALSNQARGVLVSTRDEVVRMGRIVDNLLTLARVDEGRLELLVGPQNAHELVERAVHSHRATAAAADIQVAIEGARVIVDGDRDRLEQVLTNLWTTPSASPRRVVTCRCRCGATAPKAGSRCQTTAPAFPPTPASGIFERFAREDPARGHSGGAGLGLAISREIVHAHHGRIWVEAREPRGSAFVVALPVAAAGCAARTPTPAPDRHGRPASPASDTPARTQSGGRSSPRRSPSRVSS